MGMIWSMVPCPGQMKGIRLMKKDLDTPFYTMLTAHDGHLSLGELRVNTDAALTATIVERSYKAPGVRYEEVRHGRLRGKLYLPPGEGLFVGVV